MVVSLYRRNRVQLFWIALLIIYGLAIMPAPDAPTLGEGDKIDHMSAFVTLTLLGRSAYWMRSPLRIALGLSAFGAFIELSQAIPFLHRDADVLDWVADTVAIIIALPLSSLLARRLPQFFSA